MPEENPNPEPETPVEPAQPETPQPPSGAVPPARPQEGDPAAGPQPAGEFDRKKFEAELRKKNNEAANLRKRLKELEPLAQKAREFEDAQKTETQRLTEQLEAATRQAAAMRLAAVRAKVEALAATSDGGRAAFADPEDAAGALDLSLYIDEAGQIDTAAIKSDLAELLERKPHWAKPPEGAGPRRPAPDRTQASGANQPRTRNPAEEFAGFLRTRLKK